MHFLYPKIFILLILIPIFLYFTYYKKREAILLTVFADLKKAQGKSWTKYFWHLKNILIVFLIALFVIILARPQSAHQKEDISKKGIDIVVAMDVSGSMLAEDLQPNRMTVARESVRKFVDYLRNDRLGIIVFAGTAFTQSPLTFDYNILKEYIDKISTDSINQNRLNGTAVGDAILAGITRFKKSDDRTKVLVLLTDGDANVGVDPQVAAKKAAQEGIKIYTIGIGKVGGAPLPAKDMFGNKTIARNQDGTPAMATFNEEALRKIADIGDGQYFRADDSESFDRAMKEINSLEKREIKVKTTTEYTEEFYPYLIGLFLGLIGLVLLRKY